MKRLILILTVAALAIAGCAAPAPQPTPEIIIKTIEIPGPQPTPTIIEKTVPGPTVTIEVTPQACIDALEINIDIWTLEIKFMTYLMGDGAYSKKNEARFQALVDEYGAARDACWDTERSPSS